MGYSNLNYATQQECCFRGDGGHEFSVTLELNHIYPSLYRTVGFMDSIGEYLRTERERQNLSIEEVAKSTKIKDCFIRAIEEERFDSLPSPFYARKFAGLYAKFLGLDPSNILNRFQQYQNNLSVKPPEIPLYLIRQKRKRSPSTLLLLVFGIVVAGALVYFISRDFPKQILSSILSKLAVAPSVEQFSTVQKGEKDASLPEAGKEHFLEQKVVSVNGMRGTDSLNFTVLKAGFGKGIEIVQNRPKLIGVSSKFACNHQRVYFLTKIQASSSGKLSHVWIWEGEEVKTIDMEVKAPAWSIYSYVTIRPQQTGQWKVEVRDGSTVLSSQTFKVVEYDLLT
jgi:transcriptional regulator with XRE-family HTH domain